MSQEVHSQQTATASATSGSQTITQTGDESQEPSATLRLRAPESSERRRIQWAEDVVDNEGMGKKSSKVCCIYHKPGQSDSEDSSDSSDSDSDEPDLSRAQKAGGSGRKGRRGKGHKHDHGDGKERRPSPNAYERQPRQKSDRNG